MPDWFVSLLPEFLQPEFMQRALLAGLIVAAICPLIGQFLVLRRLSLIGDGLGHIAFAGVAAGFLLQVYPLITALAFTLFGAAGIEWLRARGRAYADLALALFFYSGIAGGVVLSARSNTPYSQLFGYLFGSILTIGLEDVLFIAGLGIAVVLIVALLYKELLAITFDEPTARISGIRVGALNMLLALVTAVTVSIGMRIVGLLMVSALMVVPVAAALQLGRGFRATLLWSVAFSIASLVAGLAFSYYGNMAPGGTIVLSSVGVFLLVLTLRAVATLGARVRTQPTEGSRQKAVRSQ